MKPQRNAWEQSIWNVIYKNKYITTHPSEWLKSNIVTTKNDGEDEYQSLVTGGDLKISVIQKFSLEALQTRSCQPLHAYDSMIFPNVGKIIFDLCRQLLGNTSQESWDCSKKQTLLALFWEHPGLTPMALKEHCTTCLKLINYPNLIYTEDKLNHEIPPKELLSKFHFTFPSSSTNPPYAPLTHGELLLWNFSAFME